MVLLLHAFWKDISKAGQNLLRDIIEPTVRLSATTRKSARGFWLLKQNIYQPEFYVTVKYQRRQILSFEVECPRSYHEMKINTSIAETTTTLAGK